MSEISLPMDAARLLLLAVQGLAYPPSRPAQKTDVLDAIRRMGVLQIDTIHVVARSPYLVLFSRLGSYDPAWLEELQAEGALFEYWAHAACFLPIEDYPLFVSRMEHYPKRYYGGEWLSEHRETISGLRAQRRTPRDLVGLERRKARARIPAHLGHADDRPARKVPARV
jgi:uncharacterized protein YcaQ